MDNPEISETEVKLLSLLDTDEGKIELGNILREMTEEYMFKRMCLPVRGVTRKDLDYFMPDHLEND